MSRIIVALDGLSASKAYYMAGILRDHVWGFKVNDLLLQLGVNAILELKQLGHVFADPKLYDIPNTVANSVRVLEDAGADLITVHASGGVEMMEAAVKAAGEAKILAVTILTSLPEDEVQRIYKGNVNDAVARLVASAVVAEVHGLVGSADQLQGLRQTGLLTVIPAFRPIPIENDDQKRLAGFETVEGADFVVVGRPIVQAADPVAAAILINEGLVAHG